MFADNLIGMQVKSILCVAFTRFMFLRKAFYVLKRPS